MIAALSTEPSAIYTSLLRRYSAQKRTPVGPTGVNLVFVRVFRLLKPPRGSQAGFEHGRRFESDRLGRGDFHGFSGLRIATLASGALFHFECSKSNDLDFLVLFHAFGDGGEDGFEGFVGGTLGGFFSESGLDGFNQFRFVHGSHVCANGTGPWQEKIC